MTQVLSGIRVLDFGRFIAGPCCAALLGDLGAEVIRVERREGGEDRWVGPLSANGEGGLFLQNNRNKLSVTLDPMSPSAKDVIARLVASADVVIANLPAKVLAAMGLDFEALCKIKPDIILASISAFGSSGPYSQRLGFDAVGQLMSGAASRTGPPNQPVRTPVQYVDYGTALSSTIGVLAAIMHHRATGEGQLVEASLLSTALMMASSMIIEQGVIKANRIASLNRGQQSAPNDIFAVKDGWILIQVVGQGLFKRWAALMGDDHWLTDPRYKDDFLRGLNWEEINARTSAWCADFSQAEALAALEAARIPAYPVNTVQQAIDDPHVQATGLLQPTDYPGLPRPAPLAKTPFKLSATPVGAPHRAPTLGEHTDQVLQSVGYDAAQITALREQQVI